MANTDSEPDPALRALLVLFRGVAILSALGLAYCIAVIALFPDIDCGFNGTKCRSDYDDWEMFIFVMALGVAIAFFAGPYAAVGVFYRRFLVIRVLASCGIALSLGFPVLFASLSEFSSDAVMFASFVSLYSVACLLLMALPGRWLPQFLR